MATLIYTGLFEKDPPCLEKDLFAKMAPTHEGLRRAVLSLSHLESHPFHYLPPSVEVIHEVRRRARRLRREAEVLVVAGIGGSSLGGRVLCAGTGSKVVFIEGIDPEMTPARLAGIPWEKAAINIISKSGGTLETLVNSGLALEALKSAVPDRWRSRVVLTASPGDGRLQQWAGEENIPLLEVPAAVGGRYSVLTAVGLLPAAFDGIDPSALAAGAKRGADKALLLQGAGNPALALATLLVSLYTKGLTEVDLIGYGSRAYAFARWVQQLWAESLGRRIGGSSTHRVGPTPLACMGSEDQHSLLQLFVDGPPRRWVLTITREHPGSVLSEETKAFAGLPAGVRTTGAIQKALWKGTMRALEEAAVPVVHYDLEGGGASDLGEAFFVFQAATLYAAALLEIDPFGQPGVEAGKRFTRELLR